jgi:hypothetical protein
MPATFATDGAVQIAQGGLDTGGASTGIGIGSNQSGPTVGKNFTDSVADQLAWHIGGGDNTVTPGTANSASNTGQVINPPVTFAAGAGYVNGTYRVQSNASGGQLAGAAEIEIVVAAGAITSARIVRPGSGFTAAPTFTVANAVNINGSGVAIGGGGGTLTVSVGLLSQVYMLGAAFGANKNTQRLTATAPVAIGAAVAPSAYLNRSPRAMVAGDATYAVEP